jgi:uncharacterized membrane protein HdeD (DUF308 family)
MSTDVDTALETPVRQELRHIRDAWPMLLILGICLVLIGTMAIISSFIATLATVTILGTLFFVGGVMQLVNAVTCRAWRGFVVHLLVGVLEAVVGLIMMNHPLSTAAALTLMVAAALMVSGTMRIVVAAVEHFHGWAWVLVNGFVSLLLGIAIWRHFPGDVVWVIGLFVGIDLIFSGWSWIGLAIGIRGAFPRKT